VTNPKNLPAIFLYHILITANLQSKTCFPSSHQLKSYVAPKSHLKFAMCCSVSGCQPSCYLTQEFCDDSWKTCWPEPKNCWNIILHTSKIGKLLPICLTNNRCQSNYINSKPHAKFGENRYRIVGIIVPQCTNRNRNRNLHIPKIPFVFPVSFTTEYKSALLSFNSVGNFMPIHWKMCWPEPKTMKIRIRTPLKSDIYRKNSNIIRTLV